MFIQDLWQYESYGRTLWLQNRKKILCEAAMLSSVSSGWTTGSDAPGQSWYMTEVKQVMAAFFSTNQTHMVSLMKRVFPPFIPMCLQILCDILLTLPSDTFTDYARQSQNAGKRHWKHQCCLPELWHSWKGSLLSLSLKKRQFSSVNCQCFVNVIIPYLQNWGGS